MKVLLKLWMLINLAATPQIQHVVEQPAAAEYAPNAEEDQDIAIPERDIEYYNYIIHEFLERSVADDCHTLNKFVNDVPKPEWGKKEYKFLTKMVNDIGKSARLEVENRLRKPGGLDGANVERIRRLGDLDQQLYSVSEKLKQKHLGIPMSIKQAKN